jgi:hypothetical protein
MRRFAATVLLLLAVALAMAPAASARARLLGTYACKPSNGYHTLIIQVAATGAGRTVKVKYDHRTHTGYPHRVGAHRTYNAGFPTRAPIGRRISFYVRLDPAGPAYHRYATIRRCSGKGI